MTYFLLFEFNKQSALICLLFIFVLNASDNNHTLDYTKYISNHLLNGEYYTGPSWDVMPKDCSLLALLKTTNINIRQSTQSLHIKCCSTLLPKEDFSEQYAIKKELLKNCLNFLIEQHHITYIVFHEYYENNPHTFDHKEEEESLLKNRNQISMLELSEELIVFFGNLYSNVKHILFDHCDDRSVAGLFADTDTFNRITNITESDMPTSIPERPNKFHSNKNEQVNVYLKTIGWSESSYNQKVHTYLLKIKEKNIFFLNIRFLKYIYITQPNIALTTSDTTVNPTPNTPEPLSTPVIDLDNKNSSTNTTPSSINKLTLGSIIFTTTCFGLCITLFLWLFYNFKYS
jgi:hypothetical protein